MFGTPFGLLVIVFVAVCCHATDAAVVTYYKDSNFRGSQNTIDMRRGQCYGLSRGWNDKISSFNTHGACIVAFIDGGCSGASYRIAPGTNCHRNLGECGLNDRVSSLKLC